MPENLVLIKYKKEVDLMQPLWFVIFLVPNDLF